MRLYSYLLLLLSALTCQAADNLTFSTVLTGDGSGLTNLVGNGSGLTNTWTMQRIYFGDAAISSHNSAQQYLTPGAFLVENPTLANVIRVIPHTTGYYSNLTILHSTFATLSGTNCVVGWWTNIGVGAPVVSQLVVTLNGDGSTLTTNSGTASWPCNNPSAANYVGVIGVKFNIATVSQLISGFYEWWHQTP